MKEIIISIYCLLLLSNNGLYVRAQNLDKMAWWHEAKFGMFIHFGVYAHYGGVYKGYPQQRGGAEWILNRCKIPLEEYRTAALQFNPYNLDAETWVKMAKDAGMKYLVVTAKHHDGFALFDTHYSDWDIIDATPYKKDIIRALSDACRKYGMRFGVYYSQSQDWVNPGGLVARKPMKEGWPNPDSTAIDAFSKTHQGKWDSLQLRSDFASYVRQIAAPQVKELIDNYDNIDILWWDTHMGIHKKDAEVFHTIIASKPTLITNDRLSSYHKGDTKTPEQHIPDRKQLDGSNWEVCMTMNGSWGYNARDHKWKSGVDMIQNLVDIVSKGGNYLLNVGPDALGRFPDESLDRLKYIGQWMNVHSEAIYGVQPSPLQDLPWNGRLTAKLQDNKTTLYVHVLDSEAARSYFIPQVPFKVVEARLLGNGRKVKISRKDKGLLFNLDQTDMDKAVTVVKIKLDGYLQPMYFAGKQMNTGPLD